MRVMKSKVNVSSKYIIYVAVFVITAIITFMTMNYKFAKPATAVMTEATLPLVTMKTQDGTKFNCLHGYVKDVNEALINEPVTPLPSDKKLPVEINTYGSEITGISYKIRSISDMSLIENTEVKDYQSDGDNVQAVCNIKNLIEDNSEYILQIILKTDKHEEVSYYTKIVSGLDTDAFKSKMDFAVQFNKECYSDNGSNNISKYLETSKNADETNLGRVTINNKSSQVCWGDLKPFVESEIVPCIQEINNDSASIYMSYIAGAQNDYDAYDTYNVSEYYRVRQSGSSIFLLDFEREANQVFDGRNDYISGGKINLGIRADSNVETKTDNKSVYTYFVNENTLWCFNANDGTFTEVFSFNDGGTDNIRERYNAHSIKIMNVSEDGNCDFLVRGYMNRGAHEGETGISVFSYKYSDNTVDERIFIPVNASYEMLEGNAGDVAYLNADNNTLQILVNSSLYLADLTSNETMVEVSNLNPEAYKVSDDGKSIAYSTNGQLNNTDSIRVYNMEKGIDTELHAEEGDKLKVIGYINNDFIYGSAHASDIVYGADGSTVFPMYKINIIDSDFNNIKEYSKDGIYVSGAQVNGLRLNLSRVVKNASGGYDTTSIDQLINRGENNEVQENSMDTISSDTRQTEQVIKLVSNKNENTSLRNSEQITFNKDSKFSLNIDFKADGMYYVYGYGVYKKSFGNISDAINMADTVSGMVTDGNNRCVWNKYKKSNAQIKGIGASSAGADSLSSAVEAVFKYAGVSGHPSKPEGDTTAVQLMNEAMDNKAIRLDGISVDKVLYYVSEGYPVIGKISSSEYVIISGYDGSQVTYMNPQSGDVKSAGIQEMSAVFTQNGNTFLTYFK